MLQGQRQPLRAPPASRLGHLGSAVVNSRRNGQAAHLVRMSNNVISDSPRLNNLPEAGMKNLIPHIVQCVHLDRGIKFFLNSWLEGHGPRRVARPCQQDIGGDK